VPDCSSLRGAREVDHVFLRHVPAFAGDGQRTGLIGRHGIYVPQIGQRFGESNEDERPLGSDPGEREGIEELGGQRMGASAHHSPIRRASWQQLDDPPSIDCSGRNGSAYLSRRESLRSARIFPPVWTGG
jgi:hypothetical protein